MTIAQEDLIRASKISRRERDEGAAKALAWLGTLPQHYGGIAVSDNTATNTTLNGSTGKVQVTVFDTNCSSSGVIPDHTNDHITIDLGGDYLITIAVSVRNIASQNHELILDAYKNNGATALTGVEAHRSLTGGSGDFGSVALTGIVTLAKDDTVELWANTDASADRDVRFRDVTMIATMVGGV
jgi:hypothetical protein